MNPMKLKTTDNIPAFLQAVQKCKAEVFFITPNGDKLALKSVLSQFVFATVLVNDLQDHRGVIIFEDPRDAELLTEYLIVS